MDSLLTREQSIGLIGGGFLSRSKNAKVFVSSVTPFFREVKGVSCDRWRLEEFVHDMRRVSYDR